MTSLEASTADRPACIVCGTVTDPYCTKDRAQYRRCGSCGLIFQHPLPTRSAMIEYADTQYATGAYRDYVDSRPMKLRHFEDRLADFGDRITPGRLLDVGCSCGYFLEVAAAHGFDVRGIEFSANAIAAAAPSIRSRIFEGSLENLPDEGLFDVVSAFDLIEHVPDPRAFLADCARRLKPGGVLLISTPDTDHVLRGVMGSRWPMLQPMQHLYLFSHRAMREALTAAGFEQVDVRPAYKTLRADYLIDQIKALNPMLSATLRVASAVVPASVLGRYRRINIGEILAIGRKSS